MTDIKKYDEIKEITDETAHMYSPDDYTFIVNAKKYQQTGEVEVKRVLKEDLISEASASYIFFKREGCRNYPIQERDLYLRNRKYVGPFQMDKNACNAFLKHIRQKYPEWKNYTTGSGTTGYMKFVKSCPNKEAMLQEIEQYALSDYFNGRISKPDTLAANLASQLNKVDENNEPNATRLPLHVVASLPTGVIARGNGTQFQNKIPELNEQNIDNYCKLWISSNANGVPAFNKLKEVDYLTPQIIDQYKTMNLSGAEELQQQVQALITQKETNKKSALITLKDLLKEETLTMHPTQLPPEIRNEKIKLDLQEIKMNRRIDNRKKNKQAEETRLPPKNKITAMLPITKGQTRN